MALPRQEYLDSKRAHPSMNKFLENAINWLAKKVDVKIATEWKIHLNKYTEILKEVSPKDLASNKEVNVYYIDAFTELDEESIKAIQKFVENGGGLLVAGHCFECIFGKMKPYDLPGNK